MSKEIPIEQNDRDIYFFEKGRKAGRLQTNRRIDSEIERLESDMELLDLPQEEETKEYMKGQIEELQFLKTRLNNPEPIKKGKKT